MAAAIVLAVTSPQAAGRLYNIGELSTYSESEWAGKIGKIAGWEGRVLPIGKSARQVHLRVAFRSEQDWILSLQRIRDELGFTEPVPLDVAVARTIDWERAHPPAQVDPAQFDYAAEDKVLAEMSPFQPHR